MPTIIDMIKMFYHRHKLRKIFYDRLFYYVIDILFYIECNPDNKGYIILCRQYFVSTMKDELFHASSKR